MTAPEAALAALSAGDTAWVLASTALVMLMVPGLSLFSDGLLAGNASLVGVQLLAVLATMAFVGAATPGILALVQLVQPLRVPRDTELAGVDVAEHGGKAYHGGPGELTGGRVPLGDGVLVPAHEIVPAPRPASAA